VEGLDEAADAPIVLREGEDLHEMPVGRGGLLDGMLLSELRRAQPAGPFLQGALDLLRWEEIVEVGAVKGDLLAPDGLLLRRGPPPLEEGLVELFEELDGDLPPLGLGF